MAAITTTIPFVSGVDQRQDARVAPPGVLETCSGFRVEKDGSLRARVQFSALGVNTSAGDATFFQVTKRGNSLVALGDTQARSYPTRFFEWNEGGPSGAALTWRGEQGSFLEDIHNVPSLSSVREMVSVGALAPPLSLCTAQADIYVAVAWHETVGGSNEVQFLVFKDFGDDTGQVIFSARLSASEPKLVTQGSTFFLFTRNLSNEVNVHSFYPVDDDDIQIEALDILNSSPTINGYSVAYNAAQSRWGVLITTSTNTIFEAFNTSFAYQGGFTVSNQAACPSLAALGSQFFAARHDVATDRIRLTRISASALTATETVDLIASAPDTDVPRCGVGVLTDAVVGVASVAASAGIIVVHYDPDDLTTVYQADTFPDLALAQAPCGTNADTEHHECYLPVIANPRRSDTERYYGVLSAYLPTRGHWEYVVSRFMANCPDPGTTGVGASVFTASTGSALAGRGVFAHVSRSISDAYSVTVHVAKRGTYRATLEADGGLLVGGASLVTWDGLAAHEVGWHDRPTLDINSLGTNGSLEQSSTYFVTAAFTASDGRLRQDPSAPSPPLRVDLTGGEDEIALLFTRARTMRGRSRASAQPYFSAFRTVAFGEVPLFDEAQSLPGLGVFTQSGGITLDQSDDDLQGGQPDLQVFNADDGVRVLYSRATPEVQAPPPGELLAYAAGRVFTAARGGRRVTASKPLTLGEPLQFVGAGSSLQLNFALEVPEEIEALAALDDVLYIFSARSVFVTSANGTDRNGLSGFYPQPSRLPTSAGTTNPESIVEIPEGLMVNLGGRLSLLPRGGGSPAWVGEPVRDVFTVGRTVAAAVTRSEQHEVALFLDDGSSIALDLRSGQWTTGVALDLDDPVVSAAEVSGRLFVCDNQGVVHAESPNGSYAGAAVVPRQVSTRDISLARVPQTIGDPLGFGELHKVGLKVTARGGCTIQCEVSQDSGLTWQDLGNRSIPASGTLAVGTPVDLFWSPTGTAKSTQVRARFTLTNNSDVEGARLHAMMLSGTPAAIPRSKASSRSDG